MTMICSSILGYVTTSKDRMNKRFYTKKKLDFLLLQQYAVAPTYYIIVYT